MRVIRWLFGGLLVLILVAVVALGGLLGVLFGRALPQTSGTIHVPGLVGKVTVERDATGIPQIYAANPDDLFFAQGWFHASERMWQMEIWRRAGAGRLAELLGSSAAEQDAFIRTLGWRQAGEADYQAASPTTKRALERYADGVNAWLAANKGKMGFPFVVAALNGAGGGFGGFEPEPWTPADSTTFAKLQAWGLSDGGSTETLKAVLDAWFGGNTALTELLTPAYPAEKPVIAPSANLTGAPASVSVPSAGTAAPSTAAGSAPSAADADLLLRLANLGKSVAVTSGFAADGATLGHPGLGSNNWVVGPGKSATGTALLANDPHLGISLPSVWIMNGLRCAAVGADCPYDVVGVSFPGTPSVILGHNARIAWAVTNVGPDVQDYFLETVDPANPNNYLYKGASVPFETRTETVKIKGGTEKTLTIRSTVHGPVVTDLFDDFKASGKVYTMRWSATTQADGLLDSFIGIDAAGSWEEFREALRGYGAPSQNFIYADIDGNIGYQVPGWIPVRPASNPGDRIVDGSTGANDWAGYIPFDELPSMYNPPEGFIVTANNAVTDSGYKYLIGNNFDAGYRAERIRQLLEAAIARGGVTQADLAAIQTDTHTLRADDAIPVLLAAKPATDAGRAVQTAIAAWDRTCPISSTGCSAFETASWRLRRALFEPWVGDKKAAYIGSDYATLALRASLLDPASRLWDDPATEAVETQASVVSAALDSAGADLRSAPGTPANWQWGRLHTVTLQEQSLGANSGIFILEWFLNKGPFPAPGTSDAVNNITITPGDFYVDGVEPAAVSSLADLRRVFDTDFTPSYRLTYDLGDVDSGTIVTTTGQSGNPFDQHFGDLVSDWLEGRSRPLPFSKDAVERAKASTLVMEP